MPRPSSVQKLPPEIRGLIGALRENGCSIDDIMAKLRELLPEEAVPSRSALGRHIKGMAQLSERIRRSREVSEALVRRLGTDENKTAALNIEVMQTAVLDLFLAADEDGGTTLDVDQVALLARTVRDLATARKSDVDTVLKVRTVALAEAAKAAEGAAKEAGLGAATIDAIKRSILGIKS